jgi:sugar phosphate isomerase/epimerase
MKIGCCWLYAISKYGYPPPISHAYSYLEDAARLGFKAVELEIVGEENLAEFERERAGIKQRCEDLDLKVLNFIPVFYDTVSLDRARRERALEGFRRGLELAVHFGCETIQSDSYTPPLEFIGEVPYQQAIKFGSGYRVKVDPSFEWQALWDVMVESFARLTREAGEAGVKFCVEPRTGELLSNSDSILRMADAIGDDNFGLVFDTAHLHSQKEILPLSVEKLGRRIFYVHVSDNDSSTNAHLGLGRGNIDWVGVFQALKKHHYSGWVGIDVGGVPDLNEQYSDSRAFLLRLAEEQRTESVAGHSAI